MNLIIKKIIDRIYVQHDFDYFVSLCSEKIVFLDELLNLLKEECNSIHIYSLDSDPSIEIKMSVNTSNSKVKYTSILTISKIVKCFYLQHEFEIENPDPDRMDYYLDSFSDTPYSKQQFRMEEKVINYLEKMDYFRLDFLEIVEPCPQIRKFKDAPDSQMSVGNAIFSDFWELCEEN